MKTISVRQPFAWLIVMGFKPIENRDWRTKHRGRLLIHAGRRPHDITPIDIERRHGIAVDEAALHTGGIIGSVELVDVITESSSPWFTGPVGWLLARPRALPFVAARGLPGIFDVDIA